MPKLPGDFILPFPIVDTWLFSLGAILLLLLLAHRSLKMTKRKEPSAISLLSNEELLQIFERSVIRAAEPGPKADNQALTSVKELRRWVLSRMEDK